MQNDKFKNLDIEAAALAIELDAGVALPLLRQSLAEAKQGQYTIAKRGRPIGSVKISSKKSTTLRLDESVLMRWRATGKGWQTRA
ncbi:MAG: hypothetical protein RLZZ502_488, partial [Pseudomonadota bacterium]